MAPNRPWTERETGLVEELFNNGFSDEQIVSALHQVGCSRTVAAIKTKRIEMDCIDPEKSSRAVKSKLTHLEQDASFCERMNETCDGQNYAEDWPRSKWSKAYAAVQQRGGNDGSL